MEPLNLELRWFRDAVRGACGIVRLTVDEASPLHRRFRLREGDVVAKEGDLLPDEVLLTEAEGERQKRDKRGGGAPSSPALPAARPTACARGCSGTGPMTAAQRLAALWAPVSVVAGALAAQRHGDGSVARGPARPCANGSSQRGAREREPPPQLEREWGERPPCVCVCVCVRHNYERPPPPPKGCPV